MKITKKQTAPHKKRLAPPLSLKSASVAGISFEDKVAAFLFCEILSGKSSLGKEFRVVERIERVALDWEPFGDLLLTVTNNNGTQTRCCCSVKSNRQVNAKGCNAAIRDGLWSVIGKPVYARAACIKTSAQF